MNDLHEDRPAPFKGLWLTVFRIRGIGVYVEPTVLLLLAVLIVAAGGTLALLLILVGSVLAHELGHAAAARRRGLAVSGIYLHVFALTHVERGRPADEVLVALAGPVANLVVAGILLLIPRGDNSLPGLRLHQWLSDPHLAAVGCNLLMAGINLVPVLPADGGRALRALFRMGLEPAAAHALSALVNTLAGVGLVAASLFASSPLDSGLLFVLGLLACLFGWREARSAASRSG